MNIRKTKLYKTMTSYKACSFVEHFGGEDASQRELQAAWQWLLDTGTCWQLQGWYGREAWSLLQQGLLEKPLEDHTDFYGQTIPSVFGEE